MALALDEPKDDDETYEEKGLTFLVEPTVQQVMQQYGTILIDYKDYPWGGQIVVKAGSGGDCC